MHTRASRFESGDGGLVACGLLALLGCDQRLRQGADPPEFHLNMQGRDPHDLRSRASKKDEDEAKPRSQHQGASQDRSRQCCTPCSARRTIRTSCPRRGSICERSSWRPVRTGGDEDRAVSAVCIVSTALTATASAATAPARRPLS